MKTDLTLVLVDSLAWVAISLVVGTGAAYLPAHWLQSDTFITRIRAFEAGGRVYRRVLAVQRWKDRLPETRGPAPGERASKQALAGRSGLPLYLIETRRAEYVHLAIAAAGPLFALWNPAPMTAAMTVFGILFNAPFIAVQRYNRARIMSLPSSRSNRMGQAI